MISILSNSCVGSGIYQKLGIKYNSPLIGSLFLNDADWLRLCERPNYYFSLQPEIVYPSDMFTHEIVAQRYPVVKLENVRIDFIHEKDGTELYEKYMRRVERFNSTRPVIVWSFSEIMSDHEDYHGLIDRYLSFDSETIFAGPPDFFSQKEHYVSIKCWEGIKHISRNKYGIPVFNNQLLVIEEVAQFLSKYGATNQN